eukprot:Pgem_evm1s14894
MALDILQENGFEQNIYQLTKQLLIEKHARRSENQRKAIAKKKERLKLLKEQ